MQDAPPGSVTAHVLCKGECAVDSSVFKRIPTVKTEYCSDLVTGMNALLVAGLKVRGEHPNDKFVFVSDTTIPVKPFSLIFGRLASTQTSDVCIPPRHTWNSYQPPMKREVFLNVKHHQWIVLSRRHAELAVRRFRKVGPHPPGLYLKNGQRPPTLTKWTLDKGHPRSRLRGCVDEFWYMQQLYGTFTYNAGFTEVVPIQGLTNVAHLYLNSEHDQGKCDTFVHAAGWEHGLRSNFTSVRKLLAETKGFKVVEKGSEAYHPDDIEQMSADSLEVLRASPFLFARKIPGNLKFASDVGESFPTAFQRVVLARSAENVDNPFADASPRRTTAPHATTTATTTMTTTTTAATTATTTTTSTSSIGSAQVDEEGPSEVDDAARFDSTIAPSGEDSDVEPTVAPSSEDSDVEPTVAPSSEDSDVESGVAPSSEDTISQGTTTSAPEADEDDWFDDDVADDDDGSTPGAADEYDDWDDDEWDDDGDDLDDVWED